MYKGNHIRLSAYFLAETLQIRMKMHDIFKILKGKNKQQKLLGRIIIQNRRRDKDVHSETQVNGV